MSDDKSVSSVLQDEITHKDELSSLLQEQLVQEKDKRREDWFFGVVVLIVIFDIVFFTVMPSFGGPLALLILELLILVPLARRMGMEHIRDMLDSVLGRIASGTSRGD